MHIYSDEENEHSHTPWQYFDSVLKFNVTVSEIDGPSERYKLPGTVTHQHKLL